MIQRGVEAYLSNLLTGLNVHSNLSRLIGDGGSGGTGTYVLPPTRYTVTARMTLHQGGQLREPFHCFINYVGTVTRQCPYITIVEESGEPKLMHMLVPILYESQYCMGPNTAYCMSPNTA